MKEVAFSLKEAEIRRMEEFLEALRMPCNVEMSPESIYNNVEFESEFRSRLLMHHCFVGTPLFQESFDSAFIAACQHAGQNVTPAAAGSRFLDVVIDGRKISLKSSKAQSLKLNALHISKLTEAAWIQDCRTSKMRQQRALELFEEYCSEVDSIIQLRYFSKLNRYELVEIPVLEIFGQVKNLKRSSFSSDGPSVEVPEGKNPPDFVLKLDRSDSKVTIARINKDVCLTHGTWQLQ